MRRIATLCRLQPLNFRRPTSTPCAHERAGTALWLAKEYFHAEPDGRERAVFTIVIPPPNVTGALHLGHALNNTLQDILIRMQRMQGYNTLWMPGTDHAGIATQAVVEKRLREEEKHHAARAGPRGARRAHLGVEGDSTRSGSSSQLKQMGCSCDWDRTRFTFDEGCARAVRQTFFDLFSDGPDLPRQAAGELGHVPANRRQRRRSVSRDREGALLASSAIRSSTRSRASRSSCTVATTRPETMLGDTAVAVHPDPAAALDKAERELREQAGRSAAEGDRPNPERSSTTSRSGGERDAAAA